MLWTNILRQLSGAARLEEVAEQAASIARHSVWNRVQRQIGSMGPAEARGYVRARSAAVMHRVIDQVIRHDASLSVAIRARLITLATESITRAIADQVVFAQATPAATTAPTYLRRAA